MCSILIAETLIEPKTRLTWPYGDLVPGGYIAKVSLPLFCVLMAIAVSKKSKAGIFSGMIGLLSIGISALTGERTNFLIRACGGILASIVWKPKFLMVSLLIFIEVLAVLALFFTRPDLSSRFGDKFLNSIPIANTSDNNPYWGAWRGGIQQGLLNPIKGIGPSGTRNTCANLDTNLPEWLPGKNYCGNHPHNFYVQLFAEVGTIGLVLGCVMFGSLIITCFKARLANFNCPMAGTAFVVPLGLFFPIQQFGSFYGQWGNLFTWFAIAFAVSQYQGAVGVAVYTTSIRFTSDYHWSKRVVIIGLEILFALLSYVKDPTRYLLNTEDAIFNFVVFLIYLLHVHSNGTDVFTLYFKTFPESHRGETFVEHVKKLMGRP